MGGLTSRTSIINVIRTFEELIDSTYFLENEEYYHQLLIILRIRGLGDRIVTIGYAQHNLIFAYGTVIILYLTINHGPIMRSKVGIMRLTVDLQQIMLRFGDL